ncbi:hypothetical protein LTR95_000690 [Oleoguttula sp. CCFEE 5521]
MADPISIVGAVASIVQLIDFSTRVLVRLNEYQSKSKDLLNLRSAATGGSYLQGRQYAAWKTTGHPYTWLHGSAGSGKTILSAGIVDDLQAHCRNDPARSLAIFFFDFNDVDKQDSTKMIKSLLSQFLEKCPRVPEDLQAAYGACGDGSRQASEQQLLGALKVTLKHLPAPFVVLDALDERGARKDLSGVL